MTYKAIADSDDPEAWHEARRQGVTATDVSRLAHGGKAVWATVKAEKAGGRRSFSNAYMQWGLDREPAIAKKVCGQYPVEHNTNLLQSEDDPRWLATPDLIDPHGSLVGDIKTAVWKGAAWSDPPPNYYDQIQWQMLVTGIREAVLVVEFHDDFIPVDPFPTVIGVEWDEKRVEELVEVAETFLAMGEPSPFDLYLADYARAKLNADLAAGELREAEDMIRKEIGDRDSFKFVSDAGSISLTTPRPTKRFDSKLFGNDFPDLYDEYVKETQGKPRLTISLPKETA